MISDLDLAAMVETTPGIERRSQTLIFASGKPGIGSIVLVVILVAAAAFAINSSNASSVPANGGTVIGLLFLATILFLSVSRQWSAEIDVAARRQKISRRFFGRWRKTTVDCPLDECSALGTIEYDAEGHISYGVYVELRDGARHAIPLTDSTFNTATRVASQLSAATGIPRLDTKF